MPCCCGRCHFMNRRISSRLGNSIRARKPIRERKSSRSRISITSTGAIKTKSSSGSRFYTNQSVSTLTDGNEATHVQGESVSADLFSLLGVQPILGRTFLPKEDEPGNHVVVLSYGLWQRQFGADRGIIGKTVVLDGKPFEVIGVMPPRFTFP